MKRNLQVVKLIWVLGQGFFLPAVLWLDDLRASESYGQAIGIFLLLEAMYIIDAFLFLKIFRSGSKEG